MLAQPAQPVPRRVVRASPRELAAAGDGRGDAAVGEPPADGDPGPGLAPGLALGNRYELRELLGSGGMGDVYAVRDRLLDQEVALKFVRPDLACDPKERERLCREVRLAHSVTHVNVARTYTLEEMDGHLFIAMELLRGRTLAKRLEEGPLPIPHALRVARDLLAGLSAAHLGGVIHRDIKPLNVALCDDGRAVLMDFGLARPREVPAHQPGLPPGGDGGASLSTRHTTLGGTPGYMAPEIVTGAPASVQSDLYSFGVVLFEMLAGRAPFTGDTPLELCRVHVENRTPDLRELRPEVPGRIAETVRALLAKDPAERPSSADAVRAALALEHGRTRPTAILGGVAAAAVVTTLAAFLAIWGGWARPLVEAADPVRAAQGQTPVAHPVAVDAAGQSSTTALAAETLAARPAPPVTAGAGSERARSPDKRGSRSPARRLVTARASSLAPTTAGTPISATPAAPPPDPATMKRLRKLELEE